MSPDKQDALPAAESPDADASRGFGVLLEDGVCLVVNKPAGVATQAPPGIDSLEARVRRWLAARAADPEHVYLGIPHRLDRPTTGAIVFATRVRAARKLSRQFEHRSVLKKYWALVQGHVVPPAGQWEDWLRKVPGHARGEVVAAEDPDARQARLRYRTLARHTNFTWLELEMETGRMHQIRLQAAARGHPVIGDHLYGSPSPFGLPTDDPRQRAIALHARKLGFEHPREQEWIEFDAPLPDSWRRFVDI